MINHIISDAADKLLAIAEQTPIDWDAFDSVLKGLEDINVCNDQYEETILSTIIMDRDFENCDVNLVDMVRHFLSCGYDVSANEGLNGGLALQALCWVYDQPILDVAKVLMNAGAPVIYRTRDDDPDEEPEGLLGSIGWKLSGAWAVDRDYAFANTLEAYYTMAEANIAGKEYNAIDHYLTCLGKSLTSVSAVRVDGNSTLYNQGDIWIYSEPLIMWFEDKPLVVSCYTDFVVNPVYVDDKKDNLVDVTSVFSSIVGATLQEAEYIGATICYLEFSNGRRLFFASRDISERERIGTFDIRTDNERVDVEQLCIECFCAINGRTFASTVTKYREDVIALFCDDAAYLLYLRPGTTDRHQFDICPCSKALLAEYTRQYPLRQPTKTTWMYEQNDLSAVRLDFSEGYLYMMTTEYPEIEIWLSDRLYNPLECDVQPEEDGEHMEFVERKDDD